MKFFIKDYQAIKFITCLALSLSTVTPKTLLGGTIAAGNTFSASISNSISTASAPNSGSPTTIILNKSLYIPANDPSQILTPNNSIPSAAVTLKYICRNSNKNLSNYFEQTVNLSPYAYTSSVANSSTAAILGPTFFCPETTPYIFREDPISLKFSNPFNSGSISINSAAMINNAYTSTDGNVTIVNDLKINPDNNSYNLLYISLNNPLTSGVPFSSASIMPGTASIKPMQAPTILVLDKLTYMTDEYGSNTATTNNLGDISTTITYTCRDLNKTQNKQVEYQNLLNNNLRTQYVPNSPDLKVINPSLACPSNMPYIFREDPIYIKALPISGSQPGTASINQDATFNTKYNLNNGLSLKIESISINKELNLYDFLRISVNSGPTTQSSSKVSTASITSGTGTPTIPSGSIQQLLIKCPAANKNANRQTNFDIQDTYCVNAQGGKRSLQNTYDISQQVCKNTDNNKTFTFSCGAQEYITSPIKINLASVRPIVQGAQKISFETTVFTQNTCSKATNIPPNRTYADGGLGPKACTVAKESVIAGSGTRIGVIQLVHGDIY